MTNSLISILQALGSQKEYMNAIDVALVDCKNNTTAKGRSTVGVLMHIKAMNTINREDFLKLELSALDMLADVKSFGEAALIAFFY